MSSHTCDLTFIQDNDLTGMSKILNTYGYDENHILPTLEIIGDAGAALGMAVQDMNEVSTNI